MSDERLSRLISLFENNRHNENAVFMEKYMRNQFPFLGIKTPLRRELMKQFYKETGILKEPFSIEFVVSLWNLREREYQNAALDYIDRSLKKLTKGHLSLMEELITSKSWWDTVDMLAQKPVGNIVKDYPETVNETIEGWAHSDDLWLQRSSIIFQLKYKEATDEELLYRYIVKFSDSKEFFIQKAIGWALREYSKTKPESVRRFIENKSLAKLSVREGSKYIK